MARQIDRVIVDAKTVLNAAGYLSVSDLAQVREIAFYVQFDANAAAGVVLIETSTDETYAGTWAVLATVTFSAASKAHYVALTGVFRVIRARISSAVTSGTVTVRMVGNVP